MIPLTGEPGVGKVDLCILEPTPTPTPRPRIPFPPESDGAALTALFDATDGERWENNDGWLYTEDIGQWHRVTTNAAGRVTGLVLGNNGLSGELPENWAC